MRPSGLQAASIAAPSAGNMLVSSRVGFLLRHAAPASRRVGEPGAPFRALLRALSLDRSGIATDPDSSASNQRRQPHVRGTSSRPDSSARVQDDVDDGWDIVEDRSSPATSSYAIGGRTGSGSRRDNYTKADGRRQSNRSVRTSGSRPSGWVPADTQEDISRTNSWEHGERGAQLPVGSASRFGPSTPEPASAFRADSSSSSTGRFSLEGDAKLAARELASAFRKPPLKQSTNSVSSAPPAEPAMAQGTAARHNGVSQPATGRVSTTPSPPPSSSSSSPRASPSTSRFADPSQSRAPSSKEPRTNEPAPDPEEADSSAEPYPTFVPRNPGISDGRWNQKDDNVVKQAKSDAQKAVAGSDKDFVILGKSLEELEELAVSHGQPRYRGKQLMDGVNNGARSVAEIPVLPAAWRERLVAARVRTGRSILPRTVTASDGTRKMLLQLADGRVVETVGIPVDDEDQHRLTVCVSSQVGCPMRCTFCATGKGGYARNLAPHEIVDQVLTVQEEFGKRVSNVVFMGMGEPLLNLPSVSRAYEVLNKQLGIGARYMTISTVGVPNAISRLADLPGIKATLAVSLHAPDQELRESLVPSARAYPLGALLHECRTYYQKTNRRVTFEYTLLDGVNDQKEHAHKLLKLLRDEGLMSHVNLIPWNPVDDSTYGRPSNNRVHAFRDILETGGLTVSIRKTRGLEAAAACGQLRNMHQKEPLAEFALPG